MNRLRLILLAVLAACSVAGLAEDSIAWPDIPAALQPRPDRLVAGQPEPHELVALARAGVIHIVNVRPADELQAWDEPRLVDALDMHYHHLPIAGADDLDLAAVQAFDRILAGIGSEPALVHCSSGNRVGALYALRAGWLEGKDLETAVAIGKAHGLTRLEPEVREKLAGD